MTFEPGKFYRVPCVYGNWHGRTWHWPVMGEFHEDRAIIGFPDWHYHLDLRFISLRHIPDEDAFGRAQVERAYASPLQVHARMNPNGLPAPVLRRRKCQRGREDLPYTMPRYSNITWMAALEAAHATCTMEGRRCPHRGYDLSTEPVDENGIVTCPMHGLRWNVFTGAPAPRHPIQFSLPVTVNEVKP